ncbi:MAG TPA: hypothetical protein VII28_15445 [Puia sp.]
MFSGTRDFTINPYMDRIYRITLKNPNHEKDHFYGLSHRGHICTLPKSIRYCCSWLNTMPPADTFNRQKVSIGFTVFGAQGY